MFRLSIAKVYIFTAIVALISGLVTYFGEGLDFLRGIAGILHLLSMLALILMTTSYFSSRRR